MYLYRSQYFTAQYERVPSRIQHAFDKQAILLKHNLRHPSLHAKKYDEARGIWQARVTKGWRFYFRIIGDTYYLITIISHPT